MAYIFDGPNKRIQLTAGTTSVNLIDLHSRWKDWVRDSNAGFSIAFRAVGGDIPAIPLYLFLINGWRIIPQAADHTLSITNGFIEVEGGGDPFVDPSGSYKIRINRETPGIGIGYTISGGDPVAIANAVWSKAIETLSADEMMRVMFAALAGKRTGLGSATEQYMAQDGIKPRISFSPDESGNGEPVIDGSL
ncbi:MAG: hypothetical protein KGZ88_11865 [Methylomicrobium sp.]|nr:hypothetical protein [Methylomicrobium sp.]